MTTLARTLAPLVAAVSFGSMATAQCLAPTGAVQTLIPDTTLPATDEGATVEIPLGFTFPMVGAAYACTHLVAHANGTIYLTDGSGVGITGQAVWGVNNFDELRGFAGDSPRIVVKGGDNWGLLASSELLVDTSVAGEVKVSYVDWSQYTMGPASQWTCSVTLFANGDVRMDFGEGFDHSFDDIVGISPGNGFGSPSTPSRDLSAGGSSLASPLLYEANWSLFDLEHQSLMFTSNASGGYDYMISCSVQPASHTDFGVGCYDTSTFAGAYQHFTDATSFAAAMAGSSLTFTPNGVGYDLDATAVSLVPPSGAEVDLWLGDDDDASVTPSAPFAYLGTTPVPALQVHSNGFVSMGPGNTNTAYGSVFSFQTASVPSFRANLDLDPPAGGRVVYEEVAGVLYVTYDEVLRYGVFGGTETLQFQFELATGVVHMVFTELSSIGSADAIVGYAPVGQADNPITFATDLPFSCTADDTALALSLQASPPPVSTGTSGTTVTYVIDNLPDATGTSGVHFGTLIFGFSEIPGGVDLAVLGAPGCFAYLASLDVLAGFVGVGGVTSNSVVVNIPSGLPSGSLLFVQVASVTAAGLYNPAGLTTSNAVRSYIEAF